MSKKVLVIMPVYNQENYVDDAIQSIIQQTHTNWHLVMINDCSTDNSSEVIQKYKDNPKITILENKENIGCYRTRNRGLYEFKDEEWDLFTVHDPDDISDTRRLEKLVADFVEDETLLAEKTTYISVKSDGKTFLQTKSGYDVYASEGIAIYDRRVFDFIGYFDDIRYSGDTDYFQRIDVFTKINTEYRVSKNPLVLYLRRVHDENLTVTIPIEQRTGYYTKIGNDIARMYGENNFKRDFV